MPSIKQLNKKIVSLKNTQKITRAMKMISATKLRKAQQAIEGARPYFNEVKRLLSDLTRSMQVLHPLCEVRTPVKSARVIVYTSDRGLCGSFNANIIKKALSFCRELKEKECDVFLSFLGKKGYDHFKKRDYHISEYYADVTKQPVFAAAEIIGSHQIKSFLDDEVQEVYLLYNEFKSAMTQKVMLNRLLPVAQPSPDDESAESDYIYEPGAELIMDRLLTKSIKLRIFEALLNSVAGEHGARMTSMDSATNNCSDLTDKYTLKRNRARQAAITTELVEITSGAEALKG
jgi:F-type H+-transporting ATPase subunit gamma